MKKLILSCLFFTVICSLLYSEKFMCITIDDLPFAYSGHLSLNVRRQSFLDILDILDQYNISITGFAVGNMIYHNNWDLLEEFISRGHILGNHTYSHPDLNRMSCEEYIKDILLCEDKISELMGDIKYFRYPYLHRGNTKEKRDSIYLFLNENNYIIAHVSIDNQEYIYNKNYIDALEANNQKAANTIGREYIYYMIETIEYYSKMSIRREGRQINHILLLHMNHINSLYLDDIIELLIEDDWEFITLSRALEDSIYHREDIYFGEKGMSIFGRVE